MNRVLVLLIGVFAVAGTALAPTAAQEEQDGGGIRSVDWSHSATILPTLGYPELNLRETGEGIEGLPAELAAGRYRVTIEAPADSPAWINFVQVPAGLDDDDAADQLLAAARDDLPGEGWVYGGGVFALPGDTVSYVVELTPGEWHLAATRDSVPPAGGEVVEWATLDPVSVTGELLAPPPAADLERAVAVELTDFAFVGFEGPITAGPNVWQLTSSAEQPHHVVLVRMPDGVTIEQVREEATAMMTGTPPDGASVFEQMTGVGYSALLSPGHSVWLELDLEPGTYMALCFILDPQSEMPHLMLGMASEFVVA